MKLFLIPGNPPAIRFYELLGKEITSDYHVSSYPLLPRMDDSHKAMDTITEAHLRNFDEYYARVQSPVTILGHSVGSWFALRLLEERPDKIAKVLLVHPFLRRPGFVGHAILKVIGEVSKSERLSFGLAYARHFLQYPVGMLRDVTEDELQKCFQIARHEESIIARDETVLELPSQLAQKVHVFHGKRDWWCLPHSLSGLRKQVTIEECPEPHSFVVNPVHRKSFARRLLKVQ